MIYGWIMLVTMTVYFLLLFLLSHHRKVKPDNDNFFRGHHASPWQMVAFGMIGASISGVSLISVPGWVGTTGMTYLQMCMGFIVGYAAVAFLLLPLYYKLRLTSIYSYLSIRFGKNAHQSGAGFFLLSKLTGAAARMYMACLVLHSFVAAPMGLPYPLTALTTLVLIWLYTRRGGIATLVRTDALQTFCLLLATACLFVMACVSLDLDLPGAWEKVTESPMSRVFEWDASSPQAFWRQFLSGVFIVIVMTGLDQDMMQKNLTCRNLREAQKDMCCYGLCFLPVNFLFLALGILLHFLCEAQGVAIPARGDELLPAVIASGALGAWVMLPFSIGLVAAAFSSADSALTALTTSCCIDLLRIEDRNLPEHRRHRIRQWTHLGMAACFLACVLCFYYVGSHSVIDTIYRLASYTYGPLLGLYAFGMSNRRSVKDRAIPWIAVLAPVVCGVLDHYAPVWWNYSFGYELLLLNGGLTFLALTAMSRKETGLSKCCTTPRSNP